MRLGLRLRKGRFGRPPAGQAGGHLHAGGAHAGAADLCALSYVRHAHPIESWFDVKVEGALSAGVQPGPRVAGLAGHRHGRRPPTPVPGGQVPDAAAGLVLERIRDQLGTTDVVLWNASGQAVASAGQSRFSPEPRAARRVLAAHGAPAARHRADRRAGRHCRPGCRAERTGQGAGPGQQSQPGPVDGAALPAGHLAPAARAGSECHCGAGSQPQA